MASANTTDRLVRRQSGPPRLRSLGTKSRAGDDGTSVQLQLALPAVRAGHHAVQHIPRVPAQIGRLRRLGHGAYKQAATRDVWLDRADTRRSIPPYGAQPRKPRSAQTLHAQPGNLRCAQFHLAPTGNAGYPCHDSDGTRPRPHPPLPPRARRRLLLIVASARGAREVPRSGFWRTRNNR